MNSEQLEQYTDRAVELTMQYAPKLVLALVVLVIGMWIINRMVSILGSLLDKRDTLTRVFSHFSEVF